MAIIRIKASLKYNKAKEYYDAHEYEEAITLLEQLGTYKDSETLKGAIQEEFLETLEVGEYVTWGEFEQDGNFNNGKEQINWVIIEKYDDCMVLLSQYCIDVQPYHLSTVSLGDWEDSDLHNYLERFYINAFTETEKALMLPSSYEKSQNAVDNIDYVTIPSVEEIKDISPEILAGIPTQKLSESISQDYIEWWLQSTGDEPLKRATVLGYTGSVNAKGSICTMQLGVRPVIRLSIGDATKKL